MNIQNEHSKSFYLLMWLSLILLFACPSAIVYAQEDMIAIPTPNAASLGTFGQVPVSHFTGTPNVSFPIYRLKDGNVTMDVSLSYHTSLVKPDHPAGWVGLGWSLVAGGSITRIPNGRNLFDENISPDPDQAYINCKSVLSPADWSTAAKVDQADQYPNQRDLEPDEFQFNFGNYSGTFFLRYDGEWVVKSKSPVQFKITPASQAGYVVGTGYALSKYYRSFTIVTEDGTTYVFGNEPGTTEPVAVEFSINVTDGAYNPNHIIPTTWYLTKIISPEGNYIEFKYVRGEGMYHLTRFVTTSASMYHWNQAPCSGPLTPCWEYFNQNYSFYDGYNVDLIYPSYLDEIETSDNYRMKFSMSNSSQLKFNQSIINSNISSLPGFPTTSVQKKLDKIEVFDNNSTLIREFNFNYTDIPTSRLFLNNFEEVGQGGEMRKFEFTYNPTPLPGFNSGQVDHWGFYKGLPSYYSDPENLMTIKEVTEANAHFMQAGILTKVKYPTGGSTEFIYEPHRYAAVAERYPFELTDAGGNIITGGVRIKKIISKDAEENTLLEKEYFYVKDYINGGTQSSGILAGKPVYIAKWDFSQFTPAESYISFMDRISQPLSFTQGSHITYSEVVERESGNGYSIFKYNNYDDPAYRDRAAFFTVNSQELKQFPFMSMSYARGSLKSEQYYNESGFRQREVTYEYQNVTPLSNDGKNVRAQQCLLFTSYKLGTAYVNYTWCPYLNSTTTIEYDINGQNPVSSTVFYTYNEYNQLATQKATRSDGKEITTSYKYPLDFELAHQTPIITTMIGLHIVSPFIEKKVFNSSVFPHHVIDAEYHQYFDLNGKVLLENIHKFKSPSPVADNSFSFTDPEMMEVSTALKYNTWGKLAEQTNFSGYPVSYLWGYGSPLGENPQLPIAKAVNSTSGEIAYTSFETDAVSDGQWVIASPSRSAFSFTGTKSYDLNSGAISIGMPLGKYVLSYWKKGSGTTISFTGYNTMILMKSRTWNGWTYEEWEIESVPASFNVYGTATIDELRLWPVGAQMTSYTYNSLRQVTSQADPNGIVTFYQYDGLGRLKVIHDDSGNILRHFEYKYKQQ